MIRRLFLFAVFLIVFLVLGEFGLVPGVRPLEALLNPVFHKEKVNRYAGMYGEDPLLVLSVIKVESNFLRRAKSRRGAVGLMQLMPQTAREIAGELRVADFRTELLEDPEVNIRFGAYYLGKLRKELGDHDVTVLGAYNAGIKNVREWLKQERKKTLEIEDLQFAETRNFAQEVLVTYRWLKRYQDLRRRLFGRSG